MKGTIVQVNVSRGGVPKTAVASARVTALGLKGAAHRDTEHHGGPERAVCLYAMEAITGLRAEGHPIVYARVMATGSIRPGNPVRLLDEVEVAEVAAAAPR